MGDAVAPKECQKCGAFERNKNGSCLPCRRAYTRKWREKNADKVLDYSKSYYAQHQQRIAEYRKRRREEDEVAAKLKEKAKERYFRHKSEMIRKTREWRLQCPAEYILSSISAKAKRERLDFNLEVSDIVIPEFCPVFGIRLVPLGGKRTDATPSIDRVDNTKGYVKGNVWIISWRANRLKCDATVEELHKIVAAVDKFLAGRVSRPSKWVFKDGKLRLVGT